MPSGWKDTLLSLGAGVVVALFGIWSPTMTALVGFMVADYISGWLAAAKQGTLSSRVGFWGITKKVAMIGIVAAGYRLDLVLGTDFLRDICAYFYLANECLSLVENVKELGVDIPDEFMDIIAKIKGRSESGDSK